MEDTHRYSPAVDMLSEDGEGLAAQEERPPQPAGPLGIVTWNVAHFSKKKGKECCQGEGKGKGEQRFQPQGGGGTADGHTTTREEILS